LADPRKTDGHNDSTRQHIFQDLTATTHCGMSSRWMLRFALVELWLKVRQAYRDDDQGRVAAGALIYLKGASRSLLNILRSS
jgi:hypothetical protein